VSYRSISLLAGCVLAAASIAPVVASSSRATSGHIVAKRSAKKGASEVYLPAGLKNGHRYRLEVTSSGRHKVYVIGFQTYTYINSKHLFDGNKPFSLSGQTPYSYTFTQPSSRHLTSWSMAATTRVIGSHHLTVQVRDLGKTK
jgi:hypothetical protein